MYEMYASTSIKFLRLSSITFKTQRKPHNYDDLIFQQEEGQRTRSGHQFYSYHMPRLYNHAIQPILHDRKIKQLFFYSPTLAVSRQRHSLMTSLHHLENMSNSPKHVQRVVEGPHYLHVCSIFYLN